MFGQRIKRVEDPALLRGNGRYLDDIHLPGMLHAAFVRSPFAHARITGIDTSAALAADGVVAAYTLEDLRPHLTDTVMPVEQPSGALKLSANPSVLADGEVRHVGEPVAVVITETAYGAEDAAALVNVSYDTLPVSVDYLGALRSEAPKAHTALTNNIVAEFTLAYGEIDSAFAGAGHVFRETLYQHKGLGHAMECRGVAARIDERDGRLTVWSATQMAHRAQSILVELLSLPEDRIRVITPNVGGGFGPKFVFYQEEVVIPVATLLLGRPVKWVEDRREHFTAATMERDQFWDLEVATDADGHLLGVRGFMAHDHGAYTPYGVNLPYNAATNFLGPYELPSMSLDVKLALTNMTPVTPVRGAGRPQGTFAMERLMDRIARELNLDRVDVRRRNLIPPEAMPYDTQIKTRDGAIMAYDSGDYRAALDNALARAGYADFDARRNGARTEGRYIGIGVANYVEGTGRGPFESAIVRIKPSGKIVVYTGATDQGQGLKTALAQVCAEQMGAAIDDIEVVMGDTGTISLGLGAFASRQAVTAGSSVHVASMEVRNKALKVAAHILEAAEEDLEIADGKISVRGVTDMSVSLGNVARAVQGMPGFSLPGSVDPGMEATANFNPPTLTYCNGVHVVEVEVDPGTGHVQILNYVIVHDSGRLINPNIVEGQITGGAAHGLGCSLFERMIYDDQGQPQTTNFGEYLLPSATEVPSYDIVHMESPTPLNPLGVKGAGEGGTIPVTSAIASAIDDALSDFGVVIRELPIEPKRIVEMITEAAK
ncbi:MAG: xanthine dehydrogenase family protein molybdopterin-binding subunit [Pseudomonadota bacterium]|nr:xanthine dehydrogenase family protein molybdopterin-binding subunit [Pseudomonadota bacterium]